jgi:hypothetical protein
MYPHCVLHECRHMSPHHTTPHRKEKPSGHEPLLQQQPTCSRRCTACMHVFLKIASNHVASTKCSACLYDWPARGMLETNRDPKRVLYESGHILLSVQALSFSKQMGHQRWRGAPNKEHSRTRHETLRMLQQPTCSCRCMHSLAATVPPPSARLCMYSAARMAHQGA